MFRYFPQFAVVALLFISAAKAQPVPNTPWPEWVFHHWVWEDESTQQSATALIDDYIANDIPVGAIIIDSPWETGYNTFEWDTSLFPDAQAMIDYFHTKNVRVVMWITTAINTDMDSLWSYADSMGYFMKSSAGGGSTVVEWWKGDGSMIDFFNPDAVDWWKSMMDNTLDMGIDGWKCDGTDYNVLLGNATYSPGAGRSVSRLEYSHAYYRLFHDYTRQKLGNDRVNMSRPVDNYGITFITDPNLVSFTPRDIGWACWVGDQDATFDGMKNALNNMYQSDVNDYLIFGSDIGGYREEPIPNGREKNLFIRWAQLGAFSPLMENGGSGEHRPWIFDQQTTDIYRTFTNLHYTMIPYLMIQSDSLFQIGKSLMQFFNDDEYTYMLGSDVFVAPILSVSNNISIDFPPGSDLWVYAFNNNNSYGGGTSTSLTVPMDEYPVFIKSTSPLLSKFDSVINGTTSVTQLNQIKHSVQIVPNPASKQFKVSGLKFDATGYEIRLYDVAGKSVLDGSISQTDKTFNVSALPSGIYHYEITTTGKNPSFISGKLAIE